MDKPIRTFPKKQKAMNLENMPFIIYLLHTVYPPSQRWIHQGNYEELEEEAEEEEDGRGQTSDRFLCYGSKTDLIGTFLGMVTLLQSFPKAF